MEFSNSEIAHLLKSVAAVYILTNQNRFKVIAYEKAADTVNKLNRELKDVWTEGALSELEGIGPSIAKHLDEYFKMPKTSHLIKVISQLPASVFELFKVPGIGPKTAFKLVSQLHLKNKNTVFEDLKKAALDGKIAQLETFGEKSQAEILVSLKNYKKGSVKETRMPLPYAYQLAQIIIDYLKKNHHVKQVHALGSLRRMVPTVGDVDLAVIVEPGFEEEVIEHFIKYPNKLAIEGQGEKKASMIVTGGKKVDLRVAEVSNYGAMLQYFTGSKNHNIKLREYAIKKGYSLTEYGIKIGPHNKTAKTNVKNFNKKIGQYEFKTEEEFYKFLGLRYIEPEIRGGTDEIQKSKTGNLPTLVKYSDITGDFHIHSSYDLHPSYDLGANTYQEILNKAEQLGYEYVGFSDHNPKTGDLIEQKIVDIMKKRQEFIYKHVRSKKVKYFIALEVDILPSGQIALPEKALDFVDFIIVSIHSRFTLTKDETTKRFLKALEYPKVKIIGHPTARLLGKREGIDADWSKIFAVCRKKDIALEINSGPERLDLPDYLVREAKDRFGLKFVIDTDAHHIDDMEGVLYGVSVARRGWTTKNDIINTMSYDTVKAWIKKR